MPEVLCYKTMAIVFLLSIYHNNFRFAFQFSCDFIRICDLAMKFVLDSCSKFLFLTEFDVIRSSWFMSVLDFGLVEIPRRIISTAQFKFAIYLNKSFYFMPQLNRRPMIFSSLPTQLSSGKKNMETFSILICCTDRLKNNTIKYMNLWWFDWSILEDAIFFCVCG